MRVTLVAAGLLATSSLLFSTSARAGSDGESASDLGTQTKPQPTEVGAFRIQSFGIFRSGYDYVQSDPKVDFVGQNSGFFLDLARIGFEAHTGAVSARISLEGASPHQTAPNTPEGTTRVSLRDAFVHWDVAPAFRIQLGQTKAPWAREELRGVQDRPFATSALGFEGVAAGRGYDQPSLAVDRQLGVLVTTTKPMELGDFRLDYALMVANGNGRNQLLDDNGKPMFVGRIECGYLSYFTVGAGAYANERRVGTAPNRYDETDVGLVVDAMSKIENLELFATYAQVSTKYPTTGAPDRKQVAWHAQASYRIEWAPMPFALAYRMAHFSPYAQGAAELPGGASLSDFSLDHHTVGVRLFHPKLPLSLYMNYTVTLEPSARSLANDRLTLLGQFTF